VSTDDERRHCPIVSRADVRCLATGSTGGACGQDRPTGRIRNSGSEGVLEDEVQGRGKYGFIADLRRPTGRSGWLGRARGVHVRRAESRCWHSRTGTASSRTVYRCRLKLAETGERRAGGGFRGGSPSSVGGRGLAEELLGAHGDAAALLREVESPLVPERSEWTVWWTVAVGQRMLRRPGKTADAGCLRRREPRDDRLLLPARARDVPSEHSATIPARLAAACVSQEHGPNPRLARAAAPRSVRVRATSPRPTSR
jgi:hypothetical protein